jgi:hypothetical protein
VSKNILPTHTCFDDTVELIWHVLCADRQAVLTLRVIHAICLFPGDDAPYAHAWVEHKEDALFMGILNKDKVVLSVNRFEYHRQLRVQEYTEYSLPDIFRHLAQQGSPPLEVGVQGTLQ